MSVESVMPSNHLILCHPLLLPPSIFGILQARTLEWGAISFSHAWKWKVKGKSLSPVWLLAIPWTAAYQAPPSMGFSRQEYWSGVPLPSPILPLDSIEQGGQKSCLGPREGDRFPATWWRGCQCRSKWSMGHILFWWGSSLESAAHLRTCPKVPSGFTQILWTRSGSPGHSFLAALGCYLCLSPYY